ncbi:MAG: signal recognition particle protein, partial [Propionibacteriaceae bacterium]|nr:signal recognition particle protein [Propionibacteriaceae bacterium]
RRPAARQQAKKRKAGKGVSGNPAKRNQPAVTAAPAEPVAPSASPFGMPTQPSEAEIAKAMGEFQLPPDLQKLLNQGK